ncbi:MAG TPA: ribosome maturation factor RimM [Candidatus Binatia bacterium]|jgi:16S rRNA processing protein RimM|nr:ribosome maturation factor RimM [Candidatus Binatia bacterium]
MAPDRRLPGTTVDADPTAVAVAEITGAHALRGMLRVHPYQPPAPSLIDERAVLLERDGQWREVRIAHIAPHGGGSVLLLTLDEVTDRTAAENLRGTRILVREADLPPVDPDEFYVYEMLGFAVDTVDGRHLGTIADTMATGLNDVWIVRDGTHEHLIPVIADVVRTIDRDARRVLIDPMPGLLD